MILEIGLATYHLPFDLLEFPDCCRSFDRYIHFVLLNSEISLQIPMPEQTWTNPFANTQRNSLKRTNTQQDTAASGPEKWATEVCAQRTYGIQTNAFFHAHSHNQVFMSTYRNQHPPFKVYTTTTKHHYNEPFWCHVQMSGWIPFHTETNAN